MKGNETSLQEAKAKKMRQSRQKVTTNCTVSCAGLVINLSAEERTAADKIWRKEKEQKYRLAEEREN